MSNKNLAWRAAELLQNKLNVRQGVRIFLEKKIPVAAGLAGGSSDAAAVLRGLNKLWGCGLSLEELLALGSELGSDVPFCVQGGAALATGRGDELVPLPSPPACWVVLAKPDHGVPTREIYSRLGTVTKSDYTEKMLDALQRQDYKMVAQSLGNALEQVTTQMYPEVARLKQKLLQFGADGVSMSGSGPTVYGLVQTESKATRLVNSLRGFCRQVYAVRMLTNTRQKQPAF
jgi:4-diphosphocytidyl-2-C-methyl-D-erythritol kinase